MRKTDNRQQDQQGFASIVIALVLIIILALLSVGFAALARREQQNALDKQLANQAYYAAESGINDMSNLITQAYNNQTNGAFTGASLSALDKLDSNTCISQQPGVVPPSQLPNNIVDQTYNVLYTCALLDMHPANLLKSQLGSNTSWNTVFSTNESGNVGNPPLKPLSSFTVNWSSNDNKTARTSGGFPALSAWGAQGVLQVSLTPLGQMDRSDLLNNTFTAYLYPMNGGGTTTYTTQSSPTAAAQAPVVNATCTGSPTTCSVQISNLTADPASTAGESYLVNITDYYDTSNVSITKALDTSGNPLDFYNSQAQVDVTGKDKDVLKRLQVRIPLGNQNNLPSYALQAQDICKRLDTAPNSTTYESAGGGATPPTLPDGYDPCSFDNNIPSH